MSGVLTLQYATFALRIADSMCDRTGTREPEIMSEHEVQDRSSTDRIEKRLVVLAPRSRVWRAIATAEEFGAWFGVKLDGEFAEGGTIRGTIIHPDFNDLTLSMLVERIEPERYFAYRWHPNAIDLSVDYSGEPTTLVEFTLDETEGGTAIVIVESGFDRLPPGRRDEAFRMNGEGWSHQILNVARHVA
jgi:uncharacterized protein YndB with AHSA1/START domain